MDTFAVKTSVRSKTHASITQISTPSSKIFDARKGLVFAPAPSEVAANVENAESALTMVYLIEHLDRELRHLPIEEFERRLMDTHEGTNVLNEIETALCAMSIAYKTDKGRFVLLPLDSGHPLNRLAHTLQQHSLVPVEIEMTPLRFRDHHGAAEFCGADAQLPVHRIRVSARDILAGDSAQLQHEALHFLLLNECANAQHAVCTLYLATQHCLIPGNIYGNGFSASELPCYLADAARMLDGAMAQRQIKGNAAKFEFDDFQRSMENVVNILGMLEPLTRDFFATKESNLTVMDDFVPIAAGGFQWGRYPKFVAEPWVSVAGKYAYTIRCNFGGESLADFLFSTSLTDLQPSSSEMRGFLARQVGEAVRAMRTLALWSKAMKPQVAKICAQLARGEGYPSPKGLRSILAAMETLMEVVKQHVVVDCW
ncbi:MAG: hypothetical protein A2341_24405 [Deltaproteobacteria bacterium RIFOXYB12_FULL_58_9]|nr:MAG: hypothetical protein A2341_24405 [Deltaproteobacteria bacterium RIFOXYB12_FULL_58_9]